MNALLIEDNPDHVMLIESVFFQAFNSQSDIEVENSLAPGLKKLQCNSYDICLCDLNFPDSSSEETIAQLQMLKSTVPIVILTALDDMTAANNLVKKGIQDYLPKAELSVNLLHRVCHYAVQRKKQQQLLDERNQDMQSFCYSLSHDFKAPIRHIILLSGFLQQDISERVGLTDEELKLIQTITASADATLALVDNLYRYLSVDEPQFSMEPVDLNQLMASVKASLQSNSDKTFSLTCDRLPTVEGLQAQLYLVFQNLITNAIVYNSSEPLIEITSSIGADKNRCNIVVKDNGIGMDSALLDTIFTPFTRLDTRAAGSGLGLSIVKRIIKKHGGTVCVQSTPGVGSCFTIELPLTQCNAESPD